MDYLIRENPVWTSGYIITPTARKDEKQRLVRELNEAFLLQYQIDLVRYEALKNDKTTASVLKTRRRFMREEDMLSLESLKAAIDRRTPPRTTKTHRSWKRYRVHGAQCAHLEIAEAVGVGTAAENSYECREPEVSVVANYVTAVGYLSHIFR